MFFPSGVPVGATCGACSWTGGLSRGPTNVNFRVTDVLNLEM
jgi:hypothetical protein